MINRSHLGLAVCTLIGLSAVSFAADELPTPQPAQKMPLQGGGTYYRGASQGYYAKPPVVTFVQQGAVPLQNAAQQDPLKSQAVDPMQRPQAFDLAHGFNHDRGLNQGYTLNQGFASSQGFMLNQGYSFNQTYAPHQGLAPNLDSQRNPLEDDGNPGSPYQYQQGASGYPVLYNDHFYPGLIYSHQSFIPGYSYSQQSLNYSW